MSDIGAGLVLVKLAYGIIGTAAGIETCVSLFHAVPKATEGKRREGAEKRDDFPHHRSRRLSIFARAKKPQNSAQVDSELHKFCNPRCAKGHTKDSPE